MNYRGSPLSVDAAVPAKNQQLPRSGRVPRPGSRVADTEVTCAGERVRLHALLARPGVHILLQAGAADPGLAPQGGGPTDARIHLHRLTDRPGTGVLIVRPDGYVGFRAATADPDPILEWLGLVGLHPGRG
ncbi:hypothetical protein [Cryobacterium sp. TMT2-10]|uniref:aromatic-ring hydroxylase C-terminal domain-containing protein n=1 Tax=Cryobacterium sp. TMT2-10 TaxID=1259244 RepID=UPI003511432A